MRKRGTTSLLSIILFVSVSANGLHAANIQFTNGNWFDGHGFTSRTVYSINGFLSFKYKGKVDETVDLQNAYVIPPFAEAHTHQFLDVMNFQDQIDDYLTKGIFYAKNLNSIPRFTVRIRPFINKPNSIDIAYANGGLTASGGHPVQIFDGLAGHLPNVTE